MEEAPMGVMYRWLQNIWCDGSEYAYKGIFVNVRKP